MRFAISDASPLIGLALVDGLSWLPELLGKVWVTPSVLREVLPVQQARGKELIADALTRDWISQYAGQISEPENASSLDELDKGERDSLALALMQERGSAIVLIDERLGRAAAIENGLFVVGTAGLIGAAKKRGLIAAAKPSFAKLHASDFRISASVINTVLGSIGEL